MSKEKIQILILVLGIIAVTVSIILKFV